MKDTLKPGLKVDFSFTIPEDKTVPFLYPEAEEMQVMPKVFATGFMVGLFEWACIKAMNPHLDWPAEQSVGVGVEFDHTAATPPGLTVRITGELVEMQGKKLTFKLKGHDGVDQISQGTHVRYVIDAEKFNSRLEGKIPRD
jgi:fluoroacetyl-CoA thioesterase